MEKEIVQCEAVFLLFRRLWDCVLQFPRSHRMSTYGSATATRLLNALDATTDPVAALDAFKIPPSGEPDWRAFLAIFRALRAPTAEWPTDLEIVTRWYEPHLLRLYDDAPVRQRDLVQLHQIASTYSSRERFLTEMALDPPDATSDEAGAPGSRDGRRAMTGAVGRLQRTLNFRHHRCDSSPGPQGPRVCLKGVVRVGD
jgi:hypothetical protein